MKFSFSKGDALKGELSYIASDRSFDFDLKDKISILKDDAKTATLIVSHTLQVEFLIASGRLLYAWGYLPRESWKSGVGEIEVKDVVEGSIYVHQDESQMGTGYDTALVNAPAVFYERSGQLIIGSPEQASTKIEIAQNTIIGLHQEELACVILKLR
jgi:hypothetical protein